MKIEWIGETRELPRHGVAAAGDVRELPDGLAESYIAQGLARPHPPAPSPGGEGEETASTTSRRRRAAHREG